MSNQDQDARGVEHAAQLLMTLATRTEALVSLSDASSPFSMRVHARAYVACYDQARAAVWRWLECSDKDAEDVVDRAVQAWVGDEFAGQGRGSARARRVLVSVAEGLELLG